MFHEHLLGPRWLSVFSVALLSCSSGGSVNDTDGDSISDQAEGRATEVDTDSDGVPDYLDDDSDADGAPDSVEAGDDDLTTPPVDTDLDGVSDFRDPDSDDDGLSDTDEGAAGTSRVSRDTDSDGAVDLVEVVLGTDPLDAGDHPAARGEVAFVVPWQQAPEPERSTLPFETHIQRLDVYLLFDKSGDMQAEIDAVRDGIVATLDGLTCSDLEDPSIRTCVPSIFSGVGQYHDPYNNLLSVQPDAAATSTEAGQIVAEPSISREDFFEAVTCVADGTCGTGCTGPVGCPAYREDAIKLLVTFTSEDSDAGTLEAASSALLTAGIEPLGIWSAADDIQRGDIEDLARETGSFRADGTTPRVLDGIDSGALTALTLGLREVIEALPLRVAIEASDQPGDSGNALPFIDYLAVNTSGDGNCTTVSLTEDTDADGRADVFPALPAGAPVCWDIVPARNDIVEPSTQPQVFQARLTVWGDASELDQRDVFFIVSPLIEIAAR